MAFFCEPSSTPDGPGIKPGTILDAVTDVASLVERAPHMADRFDAIQDLRKMVDTKKALKNDFFRVASIPHTVWFAACEIDPRLAQGDKRAFYEWLARHPEYRAYDNKGIK